MSATPRVVVTGAAGFIGYHVASRLLEEGCAVLGLDCINDYYSVALKRARLERLEGRAGFQFCATDLAEKNPTADLVREFAPSSIVHLAAQAGVRYSIQNPDAYIRSNIIAFQNVIELTRALREVHLIFASSSSVYGGNVALPFSVDHRVDSPLSLYAATKRSNELVSHAYANLFGVNVTGLRFFTVYGPWGRPDMAMFKFADAMRKGRPIQVFNGGNMSRDFTYIDDIVHAVVSMATTAPSRRVHGVGHGVAPSFALYNIGNSSPVDLDFVIACLERELGTAAIRENLPMQPGDVRATFADVTPLGLDYEFKPSTPVDEGIRRFARWFLEDDGGRFAT